MTSSSSSSTPANIASILSDLRRQQHNIQTDIAEAQNTLETHLARYKDLSTTIDSLITRIDNISISSPESTSNKETYLDDPADIRNNIRFKTLIPLKITYYPPSLRSTLKPITTSPQRGNLLVILNKYKPAHVRQQTQFVIGVVRSVSGQKVELQINPIYIVTKQWSKKTVAKIDNTFKYQKAFPQTT